MPAVQQRGQLHPAKVAEPRRATEAANRDRQGDSFWLTCERAAQHVGYDGVESADPVVRRRALQAFYAWVKAHGVPCGRRGRRPVFTKRDLDAAVGASYKSSYVDGMSTAGTTTRAMKTAFDGELMVRDAAGKGWTVYDLADFVRSEARREGIRPPSATTIYRFVSGNPQNPRIARLIAKALSKPIRRYLVSQSESK